MAASDGDRVKEILDESIVLNSIRIDQVLHPELGELFMVREAGGLPDGDISLAEKIKILEMAKIYVVNDIFSRLGIIE